MTDLLFWLTILVMGGLNLTLIATLMHPSVQIWPPPGPRTGPYWLTWSLFVLATIGFLLVGALDTGTLGLHRLLGDAGTLLIGSILFGGGTAFASYAMGTIGRRAALGLEADLVSDGPYTLSRNPGYLGDLVLMAGYTILTDSRLAGLLALVGAVWFTFAPFAEEAWLEERYGEEYLRYKERRPRWI